MGVFSKIGGFVNRHRTKFFVGGAVVMGSALLARYAQKKLADWQQNLAHEYIERNRKQMHFEIAERTFRDFIVKLIPSINEALHKALDTEIIIAELRKQPENKVELWDKLKLVVFTKITSLVYLCTLLVVVTRIQMNVLSGFLYKDPNTFSSEAQERYLTLSKNVLDAGLVNLKELLQTECGKMLDVLPLKRELKIDEVEKLFWAIQAAVQESPNDPIKNLNQILLGETQITSSTNLYDVMILDTCDLLQSEEVKSLTFECINRSLTLVSDKLSEFYVPQSSSSSEPFVHPSSVKIPLAKLIPIINGLLSKNDLTSQIVQLLINDSKLKTFDANIYEAFSFDNNN